MTHKKFVIMYSLIACVFSVVFEKYWATVLTAGLFFIYLLDGDQ